MSSVVVGKNDEVATDLECNFLSCRVKSLPVRCPFGFGTAAPRPMGNGIPSPLCTANFSGKPALIKPVPKERED